MKYEFAEPDGLHRDAASGTLTFVDQCPGYSDWSLKIAGFRYVPRKGKEPNWFWRKMQWLAFGFKWERSRRKKALTNERGIADETIEPQWASQEEYDTSMRELHSCGAAMVQTGPDGKQYHVPRAEWYAPRFYKQKSL